MATQEEWLPAPVRRLNSEIAGIREVLAKQEAAASETRTRLYTLEAEKRKLMRELNSADASADD